MNDFETAWRDLVVFANTLDLDDRPKTRLDVGYEIYLANTPEPFPKSFDEWLNS